MLPLSLKIGSPPIVPVQLGTRTTAPSQQPAAALPVASTGGTCLIAIISNGANVSATGPTIASSGWTTLTTSSELGGAHVEIWAWFNNPGGILSLSLYAPSSTTWTMQLSEWSGVIGVNSIAVTAIDTVGSATATSGTTLGL